MPNSVTEYIVLFSAALLASLTVMVFKFSFNRNLKLIISFSGAFLLAISVLHLIPEIYSNYSNKIGLLILLGFLLQVLLEFFSGGIEHGHIHTHKHDLVVFPYPIFISLCIHSFVEGMALVSDHGHEHHSNSLLVGIIIHKVPVAIVLGTMLLSKNISKSIFILAILVFSLSSPIGLFVANNGLIDYVENSIVFLALAVGIFLHISTTILFETTENHKFDSKKFSTIVLGFVIAYLTL